MNVENKSYINSRWILEDGKLGIPSNTLTFQDIHDRAMQIGLRTNLLNQLQDV